VIAELPAAGVYRASPAVDWAVLVTCSGLIERLIAMGTTGRYKSRSTRLSDHDVRRDEAYELYITDILRRRYRPTTSDAVAHWQRTDPPVETGFAAAPDGDISTLALNERCEVPGQARTVQHHKSRMEITTRRMLFETWS
jgi:hypothetical protein